MKKVLTYKGAVLQWEADSNGHMNVMYFINKYEHAGHNFSNEIGFTNLGSNMELGLVVVNQVINYYKEVFVDDILYVESSLVSIGTKSFECLHEMYNGRTKERVSTMKISLVVFDKVNRKAIPFPKDIKARLESQL